MIVTRSSNSFLNQEQPHSAPHSTPHDPTFWDYAGDVAAAPFRGVEQAGQEVYQLVDMITGDDFLPDYDERFLGESKTVAGQVVSGAAQFATGFIPVLGQAGKLGKVIGLSGKAQKLFQGTAAGMFSDFAVFDGQEERLSNLIQEHPDLANPITEYLAADDDDGELEGRLKNVLEGLGLDIGIGAVMAGIKGVKGSRKAIADGASPDEAAIAAAEKSDAHDELFIKQHSLTHDPDELAKLRADGELQWVENAEQALYHEHGKINPSIIHGSEDLENHLRLMEEMALKEGDVHKREAIVEHLTKAFLAAKDYGLDHKTIEEKIEMFRRGTIKTEQGSLLSTLAIAELPKQFDEAQRLLKQATESGDRRDMLRATTAINMMGDLHRVIAGQGTAQGRALRSRRYIKEKQLENIDMVEELIEEAGGDAHLQATLQKFLEAAQTKEGLLKAIKQTETNGGKLFRAHNEFWINSILSGGRTFMVNLTSAGLNTFYRPLEGVVGGLANRDLTATRAYTRQFFGIFTQIQDSFRMGLKSFIEDDNILDATSSVSDVIGSARAVASSKLVGDFKYNGKHAINGESSWLRGFGALVNIPSRLLMSTDEFMKQLNFRAHAKTRFVEEGMNRGLKGDNLAEFVNNRMDNVVTAGGRKFSEAAVTKDAYELADAEGLKGVAKAEYINDYVKQHYSDIASNFPSLMRTADHSQTFAREATFTAPLEGGTIGKTLQTAVAKNPALQLVMPFVRTPMNLLKFAGSRAVPNRLLGTHKKFVQELESSDPMIRAAARGRQVMGAGIMFSALGLAANGVVTGRGPTDPNERKILEATGWQPYSVKIGDTYFSYSRFDPLAILFGSITDLHESFTRNEERESDRFGAAVEAIQTALSANVFNKSYLTGVQRVLDALNQTDSTGKMEHIMKSHLVSYIPNLITQSASSITGEDYMRDASTLVDYALRKVGNTGQLEVTRNVLGEKVEARRYLGANAVSPVMLSREKDDFVMTELANLKHSFAKPSNVIENGRIDLREITNAEGRSAYDYYLASMSDVRIGGKTMRQALARLMKSSYYKRLEATPTSEGVASPRVSEVNKMMRRYRKAAMEQVYTEFPDLKRERSRIKLEKNLYRQGKSSEQVEALMALY